MKTVFAILAALMLLTLPAHAVAITEITFTEIGPVSATVRFKTDVGAKATLLYLPLGQTLNPNGTYPGMGTAIETSTGPAGYAPTNHWIGLSGLYANADYLVRIYVVAADGKTDTRVIDKAFRTLPKTDTTPPVISNIVVVPAKTTVEVRFRTNEKSWQVGLSYGLPTDVRMRGSSKFYNLGYNLIYVPLDHSVTGGMFLPDTTYVYTVYAVDLQNNKATTKQATFRTLK